MRAKNRCIHHRSLHKITSARIFALADKIYYAKRALLSRINNVFDCTSKERDVFFLSFLLPLVNSQ